MPVCGLQTAAAFRRSVPLLGLVTTAACYYATSTRPALNAEFFTMQPKPVNGTLQVLHCSRAAADEKERAAGDEKEVCRLEVDVAHRVRVQVYRWHLGLPFVACCALGALFGMVAYHDNAQYISSDIMFDRDAYAPVQEALERWSLYSWELVWWAYVWGLHVVLVSCVTSPVDAFDTALVVGFGCLALMYLCRPRMSAAHEAEHGAGKNGYIQSMVALTLAFCVWLAVTSIPHAYEPDRMWLLSCLLGLDALMLFVHMSDQMPTMYTVLMGRVTYTVLANGILVYAYWVLPDRLEDPVLEPPRGV